MHGDAGHQPVDVDADPDAGERADGDINEAVIGP
jgi:hypothetical protein